MRRLFLAAACALAGCVNIDTSRHHYPCDGGGNSCPGGYVCGLDNYCHDPDAGAPYLCRSDTDCATGWHCGVNLDGGLSLCHLAGVPTSYACVVDGGHFPETCEGWICSYADGTCHDPDAGDYPCTSDNDCAYPNRCGLSVCVNVSNDELDAGAPVVVLGAGKQVSPLFSGPPDLFALSYPWAAPTPHGGGPQPGQTFALVQGSSFEVIINRPLAIAELINGQDTGQQVFAPSVAVPAPAKPTAVAILGSKVVWADGAHFYQFDIDAGEAPLTGTLSQISLNPPFVPTQLRVSPAGSIYAFDGTNWAYGAVGGAGGQGTSPSPILDIAEIGNSPQTAAIATTTGVFIGPSGSPSTSWTPVQFEAAYDGGLWGIGNSACVTQPSGQPLQITRIFPPQYIQGPAQQDFMAEATGSGAFFTTRTRSLQGSFAACAFQPGSIDVPCPVCPDPADTFIGALYGIDSFGGNQVGNTATVRCRHHLVDGGAYEELLQVTPPDPTRADKTHCTLGYPERGGLPRLEADLSISQTSAPALGGFAGVHGQFWYTPFDPDAGALAPSPIWEVVPLVLDRAPDSYAAVTIDAGIQQFGIDEANTGSLGWQLESSGYINANFSSSTLEVFGVVDGQREWGMIGSPGLPLQVLDARLLSGAFLPVVASFDPTREGALPVRAALAQTADGHFLLMASQFDLFMTGDVTAFAPGQAAPAVYPLPVSLQVQLNPQPSLPIIALAPVNPPRIGYAEAYLLTPLEIVHAYAINPSRWAAEVLTPPDDPSPWVSLWTDGDRARIGFGSGIVYSLPTRVPLTTVTPGSPPFSSYVQICADTFALGGPSLYRLTPSASSVTGTWTDVTSQAGLTATSFGGGRLFWGANSLLAFSPFGESFAVPLASGCP
jgi:hypothetical protein